MESQEDWASVKQRVAAEYARYDAERAARNARAEKYLAELPVFKSYLEERQNCEACKENGKPRYDTSFRGSRVELVPMCEAHFSKYQHFRSTGHILRPIGEFDFI